jgi:hypothetical protein
MAAFIASLASPDDWRAARRVAHEQARGFELDSVCRSWQRLLTADLAPGAGPAYELSGAQVPG